MLFNYRKLTFTLFELMFQICDLIQVFLQIQNIYVLLLVRSFTYNIRHLKCRLLVSGKWRSIILQTFSFFSVSRFSVRMSPYFLITSVPVTFE